RLLFSLRIGIVNNGYYGVGSFNITTEISDTDGFVIARGLTFIPTIKKGENMTASNNVTFDFNDLLQHDHNFLFNDTELYVTVYAGIRIAELIPISATTNFSLPWGAPFRNFTLGEPKSADFNLTHLRVTASTSFENHAFSDIAGSMQVQMYNSASVLVGSSQTLIDASQGSRYSGHIEFYVLKSEMTRTGRFEVHFLTPFFTYGPLVMSYG
ncbi:MAG: hypothetical protein HXY34_14145, partial [Candidatus Thorarchaeota archaeon]|nr:hypothetical protein [Candidatus Thorarchaeota archaeon]